jgi:cysteine desulfurase
MPDIYLDNAATTRVDGAVVELMTKVMTESFGNPSSLHSMGVGAQREMALAAGRIQNALGAKTGKVVFTSGGTESNNLAARRVAGKKTPRQ